MYSEAFNELGTILIAIVSITTIVALLYLSFRLSSYRRGWPSLCLSSAAVAFGYLMLPPTLILSHSIDEVHREARAIGAAIIEIDGQTELEVVASSPQFDDQRLLMLADVLTRLPRTRLIVLDVRMSGVTDNGIREFKAKLSRVCQVHIRQTSMQCTRVAL